MDPLFWKLCVISVILNLALPKLLKQFATNDEVHPPEGAAKLSFKGQLMHMFVHHEQVPVTSSLIVLTIVAVSYLIATIDITSLSRHK